MLETLPQGLPEVLAVLVISFLWLYGVVKLRLSEGPIELGVLLMFLIAGPIVTFAVATEDLCDLLKKKF